MKSVHAALLLTILAASPLEHARFAVGAAPGIIEVADVNRDSRLDLVVANEQGASVSILIGDGRGGFVASKGSPFPAGPSPNDLTVADFNRDGNADLAFANHETAYLTVLLGDGRGGFAKAPGSPFGVEVKPHTHGVAAADFNGDGNPDLVTDNWGMDQVAFLFGDGKGGFRKPATFVGVGKQPYQRLRAADLNGDHRVDLVTTNLEGKSVTVLLNNSEKGLQAAPGSPFPSGDSPFNLAIGDVNGDAKPDLAVVNSPSSTADRRGRDGLTVLLGDGRGGFTMMPGSPFPAGPIPNLVAIGDLDGDGLGDVAVSNPDANRLTLYRMRKNAAPVVTTMDVAGRPKGLALRDLNGDGRADIVVTNNAENSVTVVLSK